MANEMRTWEVAEVTTHSPDICTLRVAGAPLANPGQFFLVWLPGVDEKPISVSNQSEAGTELTICGVGKWSSAMMKVVAGDRIGLRGPFGNGFTLTDNSLLVGGGMGIAPLRYLAHRLMEEGRTFDMAMGARSSEGLLFAGEFGRWGASFATDDGSLGSRGTVTDLMHEMVDLRGYDSLYACGPEGMLTAIKAVADDHELPFQFAMERLMKCGIGLCGHCCMDGSGIRLCVEGPVLDRQMLEATTEFGLPHRDGSGRRKE
jgi:dihydroorotate dehydrogenase electron transfer subunit